MGRATYKVEGMTCGGCASSVKKAIERLGASAEVDLENGKVTVSGDVAEGRVKAAVEAAGYDFGGRVQAA